MTSTALVTAIGAESGDCKRLLGLDAIDTESYDSWKAFLLSLRARGQDHRTRRDRQPRFQREGGVTCARMTAF